jgi:tetratricopeptide (TPR) repeat protein
MQLNLFEDNRKGILLHIADTLIRARDLVQAVSVYEQLVADYPEDGHIFSLLKLVSEWNDLLAGINNCPDDLAYLQTIWLRLQSISISHSALRSTVLSTLIDTLHALPDPERIYIPPRFHLGQILMEADLYPDAASCFLSALSEKNLNSGRFLAWRGDALTLAGDEDSALKSYLQAFIDDPFTVDIQQIKNMRITDLLCAMRFDAMDEIDEAEEPAWLPVWGWLHGVFTLPIQTVPGEILYGAADLEAHVMEGNNPVPRIWFDMLIHAERLRTMVRDDRELAAVRRLMKKTNEFMFGCYLEKIRGRSPAIR